jgi:hypothetical protein
VSGRRSTRGALLGVALVGAGCGGEAGPAQLLVAFDRALPAQAAGVGAGPERRVAVALAVAGPEGGELRVVDDSTGISIEGPFSGLPIAAHAPIFVGTRVVLVGPIGKVSVLDLAGSIEREAPLPDGPSPTTPLTRIDATRVAYASTAGTLHVLDVATGTFEAPRVFGGVPSAAVATRADGATAVGTDAGRVHVFDASGRAAWTHDAGGAIGALAFANDGSLWLGRPGAVERLDATGAVAATRPRSGNVTGLAARGAEVVAWGDDGVVERLDASAAVLTRARTRPEGDANPSAVAAPPVVRADGSIIAADASGRAHWFDASGATRATAELGGTPAPSGVETERGSLVLAVGARIVALQGRADE